MIHLNELRWIIERDNFIYEEGKDTFNAKNFKRIYLSYYDKYGFDNKGRFFINNFIYDFKIHANIIKPFVYKTNICNLLNGKDELQCYTIGYCTDTGKYYIKVYADKVIFYAEAGGNKEEINIL